MTTTTTSSERLLAELEEGFLTCSICCLPYNQPKALPCLHPYCKGCLENYAFRTSVKSHDGKIYISCPICRRQCAVPSTGLDALPDHYLLVGLLDHLNSSARQPCEYCKAEEKSEGASHCCVNCEDFLCKNCATAHKKTRLTKTHLVVNIGSIKDIFKTGVGTYSVKQITSFGESGEFLSNPISICTNKADEIYVSNSNDTVTVFNLSGAHKRILGQSQFYGLRHNCKPTRCIAFTNTGYLAVAMRKDIQESNVDVAVVQSLAGREVDVLTVKHNKAVNCLPYGITVTNHGQTVVSDIGSHCLYIFDGEGNVKKLGKKGRGKKKFLHPHHVALDKDNNIHVSDTGNHRIKVFTIEGKPMLQFGEMGQRLGQLMNPMGLCVDGKGNIYVADRDNHRVQMFNSCGLFQLLVIENTCTDGNDVRPQDVALTTNEHLIVLVKGIEGVELAQILIFQLGKAVLDALSKHKTSDTLAIHTNTVDYGHYGLSTSEVPVLAVTPHQRLYQNPASRKGNLPPLRRGIHSPIGALMQKQTTATAPSDCSDVSEQDTPEAASTLAGDETATAKQLDHSAVCIIL